MTKTQTAIKVWSQIPAGGLDFNDVIEILNMIPKYVEISPLTYYDGTWTCISELVSYPATEESVKKSIEDFDYIRDEFSKLFREIIKIRDLTKFAEKL